jgi:hypothetical protein
VCHGELALAQAIQKLVSELSDKEIQDPDEGEDPYGHVKKGVHERYNLWQRQMAALGVETKDMPGLETD